MLGGTRLSLSFHSVILQQLPEQLPSGHGGSLLQQERPPCSSKPKSTLIMEARGAELNYGKIPLQIVMVHKRTAA